jgi:hypothetical protein
MDMKRMIIIAVCLMATACHPVRTHQPVQKIEASAKPDQWQYEIKILYVSKKEDLHDKYLIDFMDGLNKYGKDGYEVACQWTEDYKYDQSIYFLLKRRISGD